MNYDNSVADPEGVQGGSPEPPSPLAVFKYPMKMKLFGLNETKYFHFHGIFNQIQKKSAKRTPIPLYVYTPFPEILDPPL